MPWKSPVGGGKLLAGVSTQPQEGAAEVGATEKVAGERRSVCLDFGNVLRGSCSGSIFIWVRDVGYVPTHWEEFGRLPPHGGPQNDGTETMEETIW